MNYWKTAAALLLVTLCWEPAIGPLLEGYHVYRAFTTCAGQNPSTMTLLATVLNPTYTDDNAALACYAVAAYDSRGMETQPIMYDFAGDGATPLPPPPTTEPPPPSPTPYCCKMNPKGKCLKWCY